MLAFDRSAAATVPRLPPPAVRGGEGPFRVSAAGQEHQGSLKTEQDGRPPGPRTPPSPKEGDLVSREAVCPSPDGEGRSAPGGGRDEGARSPFFFPSHLAPHHIPFHGASAEPGAGRLCFSTWRSQDRLVSENHGVGGSIPPLGTTQLTPAKKLRGDRWLAVGTVPRPGAAQGPHGEGGGDATGVGCRERPGMTGTEAGRQTRGPEASCWPAVFFGGSGGGKRAHPLLHFILTRNVVDSRERRAHAQANDL